LGFLEGIRVLDFSQGIAGPFCTKLLADWGAEVVKVERPGVGDAARHWLPKVADAPQVESSLLFLYLNSNKRSITLDLRSALAGEIIPRLVAWADIVVESFRPKTADTLGITYDNLRQFNESLVMASVTSFGRNGPKRDLVATEIVEYADSGLMYHIGEYDREPLMHGAPEAEYFAGINTADGIMEALLYKEATGIGQNVDVSITECLTMMLTASELSNYTYAGGVMRRMPKEPVGMNGLMECADGHVVPVMVGGEWEMMAAVFDAPELLDEKFADATGRAQHSRELLAIVGEKVRKYGRLELFHRGQEYGMAFGVVQNMLDLADCPHLAAREFFQDVENPAIGSVRMPGRAFRSPQVEPVALRPAPLLGADNAQIYDGMLGLSIEVLTQEGAI
jgi:crotonobetainyl-CoA:carnitine CoA-transferase CaiB-like acyl-CoA transferase